MKTRQVENKDKERKDSEEHKDLVRNKDICVYSQRTHTETHRLAYGEKEENKKKKRRKE